MKFCNAALIFAVLFLALLFLGCAETQREEPTIIGLQLTPAGALVEVAAEKGFFEKNGVNVEIAEFTAGKFAFQAMLAGSTDLSVLGDVPAALAKMNGNDFYVLTEVGQNANEAPVIVRDDGTTDPKEFFMKKKRKLSTSIGGTPEFSTYLFLKHYEIPKEQVEIVAQKPEEMVGAISSGSVDAIAIFEPYPSIAEAALEGKSVRFPLPTGIYSTSYILAANKGWVDNNPQKAIALLKALIEAEEFVRQNPAEAKQILAKRTKFSPELIEKIWPDYDLRVQISGNPVKNWNAQADWAVETGKAKPGPKPDFSQLLRNDLLDQAKKR